MIERVVGTLEKIGRALGVVWINCKADRTGNLDGSFRKDERHAQRNTQVLTKGQQFGLT
ncbi:hypothetical protein JOH51_004767 [Rhizobium leguminosarum]|nr:hypothetical protein [Rhizobium leguminosarum]